MAVPLPFTAASRSRPRIRVLIVDDSVVIRQLVAHALGADDAIEIVGFAANGSIALARIPAVNPDVITLDIEMPEMDGLTFLTHLRERYPAIRVIMFSTLTSRGATATVDALMLGAHDYVAKAPTVGSLDESIVDLREKLVPKVKQFMKATGSFSSGENAHSPRSTVTRMTSATPRASPGRRQIVAIGVSTGGPTALAAIVSMLPSNLRVPVVIVQHMPPMFTGFLAARLQQHTTLKVIEAFEGASVSAGTILIAPGDFHMRVRKHGHEFVATLNQEAHENSCRPAVDVLFRSVAEAFGEAAIGVVLTGMGQDGLRGVTIMRANGAYIIAQDEASSVVWGMPGAIARANLADAVVSLSNVAGEVLRQL